MSPTSDLKMRQKKARAKEKEHGTKFRALLCFRFRPAGDKTAHEPATD
jgi:hypothetical protein